MAICLAFAGLGAGWLGAAPVQNSPDPPFRPAVTAAGYIYVSAIKPSVTADDVGAQTRDVFAQLKALLEVNGSSMAQLCSVQVSLRRVADFAAMNAAYADVIGSTPPTRTTFVSWLRGTTLVEISAVALPNGAYREALLPDGWAKSPRPYSYIIKTDDLVFFSGLISRRGTDDSVVVGDVRAQTETILDNAGTLLETADLTYDDVVAARIYLTSPYDFQKLNDVYAGYFPEAAPARATAIVELMSTDAEVEITMIASRKPKTVIGGRAANGLPVSLAIQAGPRVWLSGVIGDTDKHKDKTAEQTRDAFEHLRATLALAKLTFADIVEATVYMPDTFELPQLDSVFRDIFPKDPPARTVTAARLVVDPAMVEVLGMAVIR
jgi:2-iminobutanoate/2-iminopropanoate deaminase